MLLIFGVFHITATGRPFSRETSLANLVKEMLLCARPKTENFFNKEYKLTEDESRVNTIAINEVQLLLAEKRTSLAVMRTGIAVLALPLSLISLLIATSKYYDFLKVLRLLIPLGVLNLCLLILGGYLIIRSIIRMKNYDRYIHEIKLKHSIIGEFIE